MKKCPTCNRAYDDSLSFCLIDGTALAPEITEEKTLVMEQRVTKQQQTVTQQMPARRKNKFLLWLALTGFVILAGAGLLVGILFFTYANQKQNVQEKKQIGVNISASPKLSPTLKVASSPVLESSPNTEKSSPQINDTKPVSSTEEAEDITPIGWDTTASGFKGEAGQTYKFRCPEEGTEFYIYGSDIYTQDSSICTAAVHAGIITLAQGGTVTIEYRPGRSVYGSTIRNGIKSKTWGEYPRSFVVR